jgi:hypothetical protein
MHNLNVRRLAAWTALLTGLAATASAAEILIVDEKSQPESLTITKDGTLIVGSASTPFVYKVRRAPQLPRNSSMPARKAPARFSSACSRMPLPIQCGHVS